MLNAGKWQRHVIKVLLQHYQLYKELRNPDYQRRIITAWMQSKTFVILKYNTIEQFTDKENENNIPLPIRAV